MRFSVFFLVFFPFTLFASAQQPISGSNELTDKFAYEVHTMDVFFERFNFKKNTVFLNYFNKTNPERVPTRVSLIKSLFNADKFDQHFKLDTVKNFIWTVTDSANPVYARYRDTGWFADLDCKIIYKGKPATVKLILMVERTPQNAYKWSVISADASWLRFKKNKSDSLVAQNRDDLFTRKDSLKYFLSPVSHGINFSNVFKVFENKEHVAEYMAKDARSFELAKLISLIQKSDIKFIEVNKITYHLLQLKGWGLTVNYFDLHPYNSGWLISRLDKLDINQKNEYLYKRLNISPN